jgi:endonuclease IV
MLSPQVSSQTGRTDVLAWPWRLAVHEPKNKNVLQRKMSVASSFRIFLFFADELFKFFPSLDKCRRNQEGAVTDNYKYPGLQMVWMKIGVKLWADHKDYAKKILPHVDFFEVVAEAGKNFSFLSAIKKPVIIHAEDFSFQTNLANPENNAISKDYLQFALDLQKKINASYVILNPGIRFNNKCTIQNHIDLFKKLPVKKILFENQPPLKNRTYPFFCRTYDDLYDMCRKTGAGFCFDFDHAYASAFFFERDPVKFCKDILDLRPKHIHISNGKNASYIDYHLHFHEGDFNMMQMKELLPSDVWITVDTANDLDQQIEEIKFLRT